MDDLKTEKPGVEEWVEAAEAVLARLTDCVHAYKHPPHSDVFMADAERQSKTDTVIRYLRRLYAVIDQSSMPTTSVADVHVHDERLIDGLAVLFREVLPMLPVLSADMQKLLKSPWSDRFPNQKTRILFAGETSPQQGLGSGYPEQGHLPAALTMLLDREATGDKRHPREELLRHGEPRRADPESRRRWSEKNSGFLRTAGRVE